MNKKCFKNDNLSMKKKNHEEVLSKNLQELQGQL